MAPVELCSYLKLYIFAKNTQACEALKDKEDDKDDNNDDNDDDDDDENDDPNVIPLNEDEMQELFYTAANLIGEMARLGRGAFANMLVQEPLHSWLKEAVVRACDMMFFFFCV